MNKAAAAKKIQNIFRRKRVFSTSPIRGTVVKVSRPKITAQITSFKTTVNLDSIFEHAPRGFTEVTSYTKSFRKPDARYIIGTGWVGETTGATKVVAKKGKQTVTLTSDTVEVLGAGNYEAALLTVVKNEWAPKSLLRASPNFKKIDGQFNVNKDFSLEDLVDELKGLPAALGPTVKPYNPEIFPAVVLNLSKLGWTYQFFKNGTVLFSGVKNPKDIDLPAELFKKFFTEFGISILVFGAGTPRIRLPNKGTNKSAKLAERYNLAGTWNALKKPPKGYYIRPGTNGKPRFYPWLRVERKAINIGEAVPHVNVKYYPMNLKAVAPKVVKAFKNANKPIPQTTINAFKEAGFPLSLNNNGNVKEGTKLVERRAPSWNATKPGFYVRPGPGQQPYWFKVPKGLASGRKTVIATYTKAGRNIPRAVRNIFQIGNNVQTAGNVREHQVKMGLNGILRINDRQATRLTKKELLAIARNMNIPQVSEKMKPAEIIGWIQNKTGVKKPNRTYDVFVNGMFYKFLNNGRVERTTNKGVRTARNWATIPVTEQNKIARAVIPQNLYKEWNAVTKANRYNTIRAMAATTPLKAKTPTPSPSSASSNMNNFGKELEVTLKLQANLGNKYREGNEMNFMKIYKTLPVGKRGKPLKANENRAYKNFLKAKRI
jgi:TATA-box binding protein (TBP) (component of TFIID and TFIIIB)